MSPGVVASAGMALLGLAYSLQHFGWQPGARLFPVLPTGMLIAAVVLNHVPDCFTLYIRAHKREPLLLLTIIVTSNVVIGLLGGSLGYGSAAGYLGTVACIILPGTTVIWTRCRND